MSAPPKIAHRSLPSTDPQRRIGGNVPSRVGPYVVERKLASGGMGTVYLARDAEGARVALKLIHPQMAEREDLVAMFVDEARIASRIAHRNVCRVLDYGTADGRPYIAMEYLEGATVSALLRAVSRSGQPRGTEMADYAARIVADACRGLHEAHELRDEHGNALDVVHRDVTIRNVVVGYDGRVSVLDFGIARAADQIHETRTGVVKGTLLYMSPEQIRRKKIDRRSDVWSVGVVLWEMLTGRSLFRRRTDLDALVAIERGPIPPPSRVAPQVPAELDGIALRALARDPEARFATAAHLADALDAVLSARPDAPDERALGAWARGLVPPPRVSSAAVPVPRSGDGPTAHEESDAGLSAESEPGSDPGAVLPAWDSDPGPRRSRSSRDARDESAAAQASTRLLGDDADAAPPTVAQAALADVGEAPVERAPGSAGDALDRLPNAAHIAGSIALDGRSAKTGRSTSALIGIGAVLVCAMAAVGVWLGTRERDGPPRSTTLAEALRAGEVDTVGREKAPVGVPVVPSTTSGRDPYAPATPPIVRTISPDPIAAPMPAAVTPSNDTTAAATTTPATTVASTATSTPSTATTASPATGRSATGDTERVGLGTLRIVYVGGWATVSVDGRTLGSTPVQVRLPAGRHNVTLLPMGRPPAVRRNVTVRAGGSQTVRVVREPSP